MFKISGVKCIVVFTYNIWCLMALSLEMASHKRSILTQTCVTSIGQFSRMLNVSWGCLYLNLMLIVILPFGLLFSFNYYNT